MEGMFDFVALDLFLKFQFFSSGVGLFYPKVKNLSKSIIVFSNALLVLIFLY